MLQKKSLLIVLVALSTVVLAGFVSVSLTPQASVTYHPNGKANHHPLQEPVAYSPNHQPLHPNG